MLSPPVNVNGGHKIIWRDVPKLIACYCAHLRYTVRYVI
jgi:hypothetical protein